MARWTVSVAGACVLTSLWAGPVLGQIRSGTPAAGAATAADQDPFAQDSAQRKGSEKDRTQRLPGQTARKPKIPAKAKAAKKEAAGAHHPMFGAGPLRTGEEAILKALDEPASLAFVESPLAKLAEHIRQKHHIPVVLDMKGIEEAGLAADTPMTVDLSQIPLRDALDLALRDVNLSWTIKSGVLLITTPEGEETHMIARCYNVADLAAPAPDRSYKGDSLPGTAQVNGGIPPLMQGMQGSLPHSVSMGGELYPGTTPALDFDGVIKMITSTVEPTSWDEVGGPGSITRLGNVLVINQTLRIHGQIAVLLEEVRAKRAAGSAMVVELQWLWLDATQHEQLVGHTRPPAAGRTPLAVDAKALQKLAGEVAGFRGQIGCSNGQLVHLVSGDRKSAFTSAIPVIGSGVGYQPVVDSPNVGVVVELRASAVPGAEAAILDVQSTVTRWGKMPPSVHVGASWPPYQATEGSSSKEGHVYQETTQEPGGSSSVAVDRPVMPAQQIATTVRVPLGKPVVLGAMTFAPSGPSGLGEAGRNAVQLYLIATTRIAAASMEGKPKKP